MNILALLVEKFHSHAFFFLRRIASRLVQDGTTTRLEAMCADCQQYYSASKTPLENSHRSAIIEEIFSGCGRLEWPGRRRRDWDRDRENAKAEIEWKRRNTRVTISTAPDFPVKWSKHDSRDRGMSPKGGSSRISDTANAITRMAAILHGSMSYTSPSLDRPMHNGTEFSQCFLLERHCG